MEIFDRYRIRLNRHNGVSNKGESLVGSLCQRLSEHIVNVNDHKLPTTFQATMIFLSPVRDRTSCLSVATFTASTVFGDLSLLFIPLAER
jgi:hypothetical protein